VLSDGSCRGKSQRAEPKWQFHRLKKQVINAKASTVQQTTAKNAEKAIVLWFDAVGRQLQRQIAAECTATSQNGGTNDPKSEGSTPKHQQCNKEPPKTPKKRLSCRWAPSAGDFGSKSRRDAARRAKMAVPPTQKARDERQNNRNATINRQKRRKCGWHAIRQWNDPQRQQRCCCSKLTRQRFKRAWTGENSRLARVKKLQIQRECNLLRWLPRKPKDHHGVGVCAGVCNA
jgi:hypothetical protein